jgi:hypothetical protein
VSIWSVNSFFYKNPSFQLDLLNLCLRKQLLIFNALLFSAVLERKRELAEQLKEEKTRTKMLSAEVDKAKIDLERKQRNFDEDQKEKRLVDEELAKKKTRLEEVEHMLQKAYSNNERNMADMSGKVRQFM